MASRAGDVAKFVVLVAACVGLTLVQSRVSIGKLPFPPGMDQDNYLEAARDFSDAGLFMWRAPLYSAWLGTIYAAGGRELRGTYYADKVITVGLLAFVTSCLVWRLCGFVCALVACAWTLDLKYLLLETNSSHAFAAFFVGVALLLVLCVRRVGWPWGLFSLFLGACARRELFAPLALLVVVGLVDLWRSAAWKRERGVWRHWVLCGLLAAGIWGLARSRPGRVENDYFGVLLFQQFSVNYVERHDLREDFPDKWTAFPALMARYFPDVSRPVDMLRKHPGELIENVAYNARFAPRALLANAFALEHAALILPLVGVLLCYRGWRAADLPARELRDFIIWSVAMHSIVAINLVFRVISRYNLVLVPVHVSWIFIVSLLIVARVRSRLRGRSVAGMKRQRG